MFVILAMTVLLKCFTALLENFNLHLCGPLVTSVFWVTAS